MIRVFLTGPMGSGKSTLGRLLAQRHGVRFVDLDAEVERVAGATVSELFEQRGESAFRVLEQDTLDSFLESKSPMVVALGGGALLAREVRHGLLRAERLIGLKASPDELARRVAGQSRPLLNSANPEGRLRSILEARRGIYAEVHGSVRTDVGSSESQLDAMDAIIGRGSIAVPLGRRTYDVTIGEGVRTSLRLRLQALGADGVFVVTDENVAEHWLDDLSQLVSLSGVVTLKPGESAKTLTSVQSIWGELIALGASRASVVLAFGGGVVGDLAGFAASTLFRGVRFVQLPTTTLALSDASVGGKTGFDFAGAKNLIGAIHQPSFVLGDLDWLSTLEHRHFRSGLAEVAKAAWLQGEQAVRSLEEGALAVSEGDRDALAKVLSNAIAFKAKVVVADEHEAGVRRWLNFGHTFGHAIEAGSEFSVLHGEAVAMGMVHALRFRGADPAWISRLQNLLHSLMLPVDLDADSLAVGATRMRADKKRVGDAVGFVEVNVPGKPRVSEVAVEALIEFATKKLGPA